MWILFLLLISSSSVFGGQGYVSLGSGQWVENTSIPSQNKSNPWRLEVGISNWPISPTNGDDWVNFVAIGVTIEVSGTNMQLYTAWDTGGTGASPCQVPLASFTTRFALIRMQRDPATMTTTCEAWDVNGIRQMGITRTYTSNAAYTFSGIATGQNGADQKQIDFIRILPSLVALGSKPPTTYTAESRTVEWKFDGSLADASGNGWNGTISSGSPSYAASTQTPVAVISVPGAFSNIPAPALRYGGMTPQLDGSRSYGMSDSSNTVTYTWSQTAGTAATFSSTTAEKPVLSGLMFGERTFQLVVTDADTVTDSASQALGAVQVTADGRVVYPDSRLEKLFGKRQAWGWNPWEANDYHYKAFVDKWAATLAVNGGAIDLEMDIARAGTVTCAVSGFTCTGSGTSFLSVFCGGSAGPATAGAWIVPLLPLGGGEAPRPYARPVTSCASDTSITLTYQLELDVPAGTPYGTYGLNAAMGTWTGACGGGDPNFYYDQGLAFYSYYYASGLTTPLTSARWIADRQYRGPFVGYGGGFTCPRTESLASAWIRATIDTDSPGPYDIKLKLRRFSDRCNTAYLTTNDQFDPREGSYCLLWASLQAYLDTGTPKTTAQGYVKDAYAAQWNNAVIKQANGNFANLQFEGDSSRVWSMSNGSKTATLFSGSAPGSDYCGTAATEAGTISIASDRVSVTGTGTSFTGHAGKLMFITGLLSGQPWGMVSQIASVTDATHMTLSYPWRGTTGAMTDYRILSASVQGTGYYNIFFAKVNSSGVQPTPVEPDADNFYWCRVSGSNLTLDKPYTGNTTAGNIYRRATVQPLAGRGSQPFMQGLAGEALYIASIALDGVHQTESDGYKTLANGVADWLAVYATSSATQGYHYGVDFSNCLNLSVLPAYDCSPGPANVDRDYMAEANQIIARKYEYSRSCVDYVRGQTGYTAQMAETGFAGPAGDGTHSQILDLVTNNLPKFFGQMWGVGKSPMWAGVQAETCAGPGALRGSGRQARSGR